MYLVPKGHNPQEFKSTSPWNNEREDGNVRSDRTVWSSIIIIFDFTHVQRDFEKDKRTEIHK